MTLEFVQKNGRLWNCFLKTKLSKFKKANKGSCAVVGDKNDYKSQAGKQLSDTDVNKDFKFNEKNATESFGRE